MDCLTEIYIGNFPKKSQFKATRASTQIENKNANVLIIGIISGMNHLFTSPCCGNQSISKHALN